MSVGQGCGTCECGAGVWDAPHALLWRQPPTAAGAEVKLPLIPTGIVAAKGSTLSCLVACHAIQHQSILHQRLEALRIQGTPPVHKHPCFMPVAPCAPYTNATAPHQAPLHALASSDTTSPRCPRRHALQDQRQLLLRQRPQLLLPVPGPGGHMAAGAATLQACWRRPGAAGQL